MIDDVSQIEVKLPTAKQLQEKRDQGLIYSHRQRNRHPHPPDTRITWEEAMNEDKARAAKNTTRWRQPTKVHPTQINLHGNVSRNDR